jgi:hypothetical protein
MKLDAPAMKCNNVYSLTGLEMQKSRASFPELSQVEAYWENLRGDRPAPLRSEIDPRGIESALENAFILERIAPGVARFRLAGMHLNNLMAMEVRGMPLTAFFTPAARQSVADSLEHVFQRPAKADFDLAGEGPRIAGQLTGRMLILPLRSDLGDMSRAIGCLVTDGAGGRAPNRFSIVTSHIHDVPGRFGSAPEYAPAHETPRDAPNFAEPAPSFDQPQGGHGPRRGHLRLVHDSDKAED